MSNTKIDKDDSRERSTMANPSHTDYGGDEFYDDSTCGFSEMGCFSDFSGSTQTAIPVAYPPMEEHFEKSIALMKEVIFERVKREQQMQYGFSQTPSTPQESRRRLYYGDGGPGESLMKLWISRARDKNIHQGHRREAVETVWDLTRDASLIDILKARGAVDAIFEILEEFCYEPSCKAQKCDVPALVRDMDMVHLDSNAKSSPGSTSSSPSRDCLAVIENMSLSCFVEQEEIRSFALLSALNFMKHEPKPTGGVGSVVDKLISDEKAPLRAKLVYLCQRHLECGKSEFSHWQNTHMEGASAAALQPDNLTRASYELMGSLLHAMQSRGKLAGEVPAMEAVMNKYNANQMSGKQNTIGNKRSFIRSTRISIC